MFHVIEKIGVINGQAVYVMIYSNSNINNCVRYAENTKRECLVFDDVQVTVHHP